MLYIVYRISCWMSCARSIKDNAPEGMSLKSSQWWFKALMLLAKVMIKKIKEPNTSYT